MIQKNQATSNQTGRNQFLKIKTRVADAAARRGYYGNLLHLTFKRCTSAEEKVIAEIATEVAADFERERDLIFALTRAAILNRKGASGGR